MLRLNRYNFNNFQQATKQQVGATRPPAANNKLKVLYFNDAHGNTDKFAGIMEAGKNFNNNTPLYDTFILSGGDNVSGGDVNKNELVMDLMQNEMGVDVSAVGNHEIDATSDGLSEFAKGKGIHFVATNVKYDDDSPMKNITKRSIIKIENGTKYGFIGAMPLDFASCTKKAVQEDIEVMDYDDTIEALQEEIKKLKAQGVDRIILVSHTGYENDKKMASDLEGVDIIIGGHSHSVVENAKHGENVVASKTGKPVVITQAGENGKYYGLLDVEFDANGIITKVCNQLIPLSSKKSPTIEYIKEQKLGTSPIVGTIAQIDEMPPNRRIKPHGWANLIVDSMRAEFDSDIALLNAANIRKVPTQGKVTERDIFESAPMKNNLIRAKLTQKQLVDAIKQASKESLGGQTGEPGLLFASGLEYKVSEKGDLLELYFIDKKGNKNKIDINNPSEKITYTAIYDDFTMKADGEYPHLAPKFGHETFNYDKDITAIKYISKMQNKDCLEIIDDKRLEIVQTSAQTQQDNNNQKFLSLSVPKAS
ncbi:MAG: 5'-nucleotidase C-terminal domain-containing protein [Candidatus Gastranaerophilales bacterium]|nr:5'-nucleotidase C-terminal domain-containing protein [Candidatus Gastranaerophilales bacterium]